jgi:phosphoribosylaminoimidazolecarboxamide formyltransferase/IMP cyclohydrolase
MDLVSVKRALISVSDKTGLGEFATALHREFGVELISTGGTAKFLREQCGLPVTDVSAVTGFPEMMDGRLKTLHPKVHGGLLAMRDNDEHLRAMREHGIQPIDLVCINLYPFAKTIEKPGVTLDEAIENIDIGGPAMIRSAAKNHRFVLVVTSPDRYEKVLGDLREHAGSTCGKHRLKMAQRAFDDTARYDATIAGYLLKPAFGEVSPLEATEIRLRLLRKQELRYGENPHQKAALFVEERPPAEASVAYSRQLHGKELSYINLLDADGALSAVKEFDGPAACIVKHATPCGLATATTLPEAFTKAFEGDQVAAFGGIVALNKAVDRAAAEAITAIKVVLDVIVAPDYDAPALELLRSRWKNTRLLAVGPIGTTMHADPREVHLHKIVGGWLVQERDLLGVDEPAWTLASERAPTEQEARDLKMAWLACKHVKSNGVAIARDGMLLGAGAGQQDRVGACRIAVAKAGERARGASAASDAYIPFADGTQVLLDAGVTAIIQPGGSLRDAETIAAVNRAGAAMIFTGQRHFRH